jgi:predicted acetyltransferase
MPIEIRTVADDELLAYREALAETFGDDLANDPQGPDRIRALIAREQRWAAFDGGTIVATAGSFDHTIALPGGGTIPMAGLTMVTVRPTHRRRGLLRELIRHHLEDASRRGFPISGLWASEASIYQRFGYGVAAEAEFIEIDNAHALALHEPRERDRDGEHDEIQWIDEARARRELPAIYSRATASRPGALVRSDVWWRERRFLEAPFARGGASRRRHVVAVRPESGELAGYLQYRQRPGFTDGLPAGQLDIVELVATDLRAEATLWRFALRVDLFPRVTWWNAPTDDPLPWLVTDPRRVKRRRTDSLWLRLGDIPAALAARRYAAEGALRFVVSGSSSGSAAETSAWDLAVSGDGPARCTAAGPGSPDAPALRLSLPALGSLYLGAFSASRLARGGLVQGDPAALATADRLFASPVAPWCPEIF